MHAPYTCVPRPFGKTSGPTVSSVRPLARPNRWSKQTPTSSPVLQQPIGEQQTSFRKGEALEDLPSVVVPRLVETFHVMAEQEPAEAK